MYHSQVKCGRVVSYVVGTDLSNYQNVTCIIISASGSCVLVFGDDSELDLGTVSANANPLPYYNVKKIKTGSTATVLGGLSA